MRATTGHPIRALRGAGLVVIAWFAYRAPAIRADFAAAVATADTVPRRLRVELAAVAPPGPTVRRRADPARRDRAPLPRSTLAAIDAPLPVRDRTALPAPPAVVSAVALATPARVASDPDPLARSAADATAGDAAARAYARLAAGDRRGAARLFDAALAAGDDPRAAAWARQRDALTRRWSGSAYSIVRAGGAIDLAATPVLGGGQSGAALAWTPDPLAPHPLALTLRGSAAHDDAGRSAVAAVGVAWHPRAGVTLAVERLVAVGPAAHGDWTARIAAGASRTRGAFDAAVYAEAGVVGGARYAAAQAHFGAAVKRGGVSVGPGVGLWGSVQRGGGATVDRLDVGPGVSARAGRLSLAADYRVRVAGNAAPGSGPVVTLSAAF